MVQERRRVSYIIPSTDNVPRLQLPPLGVARLGATGPLLLRSDDAPQDQSPRPKYPRHRLGIASLALDTSTQLVGKDAPEGILYSGGRDGLVMSWDLGVPMKRRSNVVGARIRGRWESLTGWDEEGTDDELDDDDEHLVSDGDILGEVSRRRRPSTAAEVPRWETDIAAYQPGAATQFRQCAQAHTDWVNDILLCNYDQTLVSASSDGTIKAWNPHAVIPSDPSTIGSHTDYVRCLASCRDQNWVASGSFDRTIKLWDLGRPTGHPLVTMNPPDAMAPKSSVYALTADPFGHVVASGSPERVVRLWDPRTGKRTGKLVGHTDNIRAILVSEDSKYLLTGSADASVKLWSLSSQRCLHTFAHHTDSVWSLFSDHPSLEVFYSGDRSGLVCRVDVEDCADISEGECILLCNDAGDATQPSVSEGINKIAVMDDNLLWTASGVSTLKRWNIPQRRKARKPTSADSGGEGERLASASFFRRKSPLAADGSPELNARSPVGRENSPLISPSLHSVTSDPEREQDPDSKLNGLPYDCLIKLVSSNDPFTSYTTTRVRDPEVATLYSAASIMSVPRHNTRSPQQATFSSNPMLSHLHSSRTEDAVMVINTARALYEEREVAADAIPVCSEPEVVIPGDHGLVRSIILNDRVNALTVDTAGEVAVWDIVRGVCLGKYPPDVVAAASHSGSVAGGSGEKERSPREALEAVRERIEGEAVVSSWCSADTKAGVLTIHLTERCFDAEVYADEVGYAGNKYFNDESKLNIGKWVLRNLFNEFIKEELRSHPEKGHPANVSRTSSQETLDQPRRLPPTPSRESMKRHFKHTSTSTAVISSSSIIPAIPPNVPSVIRSSPLLTPLIPLHGNRDVSILPPIPQSPAANMDTPMFSAHQRSRSGIQDSITTPTATSQGKDDYFSSNRPKQTPTVAVTPGSPEDFSGWMGPAKQEPMTPSTPTGIMGRLRSFGKPKRPVSDAANSAAHLTPTAEVVLEEKIEEAKTPLQQLLSGKLEPPTSAEPPLYRLPSGTTILISEEAQPSYTTIYRGTVGYMQKDVDVLEAAMPMWLVEYLLLNQVPPSVPLAKLSFVLMPWNKDPDVEPLPEMLNTQQSKLTASRHLRVRKIVTHVQDKLEKIMSGSGAPSLRSFVDEQDQGRAQQPQQHRMRAEDEYEILCNDTLLPLGMSLAAVRQFVWKSSAELVMHYRRKRMQLHPGHSA